jgi:hypothetical protein
VSISSISGAGSSFASGKFSGKALDSCRGIVKNSTACRGRSVDCRLYIVYFRL